MIICSKELRRFISWANVHYSTSELQASCGIRIGENGEIVLVKSLYQDGQLVGNPTTEVFTRSEYLKYARP